MSTWSLSVGGVSVTPVVDVEPASSDGDSLAVAKVRVGNNSANRAIQSGETATIDKNGSEEMVGRVAKKPTVGDKGELIELHVADNRYELTLEEVHRPFIDMDTGEIVRTAVQERTAVRDSVLIHRGEGPGSDWDHNVPVFELADFQEKRYREYGNNLIFAGFRKGETGNFRAKYTGMSDPDAAIPGEGQVSRLKTRILANNTGDQIRAELELVDNFGTRMIWPLPQLSTNFETYELRGEDATQTAEIGTEASGQGVLEYRFEITGEMTESRAVLIDHAETLPFEDIDRNATISATNVQDTGRSITRRFDASIMEMLQDLSEEDNFISYVDANDNLHYEPAGDQTASKSITYNGGTPVVKASNEKDYDRIINKLTVVGDGDIQVTVSDEASIAFYGVSAREDQLVDKEIQTLQEARERGKAVLQDKAWHDSALTFEVADTTYADVIVGEAMPITWDPFGIDGTYIVSNKDTKPHGSVELQFTGFVG